MRIRLALVLSLFCTPVWAQPPATPTVAAERRPIPPPVVSPELGADRRVTFRLHAPDVKLVQVNGAWRDGKNVPLKKGDDGLWAVTVGPIEPGLYEYNLALDGVRMIDPGNPEIKPSRNPRTSILEVPGTPPLLTEFQDVPHGTVHLHQYRSRTVGRVRRMHVYTPPDYDRKPSMRYPVLFLQHGRGDNDAAWVVHGRAHLVADNLIAAGKARPMVIVMLDGHPLNEVAGREMMEMFQDNTEAFRRELIDEVLPFVQSRYRVRKEAQGRAIVGLSMGGHQALTIGLSHPDTFAWVGAMSAAAPAPDAMTKALAEPKVIAKKTRWLWIACGKDDFLLERNKAFVKLLEDKQIPHKWVLTEGAHTWPVWRGYLADVLPQLFAGGRS